MTCDRLSAGSPCCGGGGQDTQDAPSVAGALRGAQEGGPGPGERLRELTRARCWGACAYTSEGQCIHHWLPRARLINHQDRVVLHPSTAAVPTATSRHQPGTATYLPLPFPEPLARREDGGDAGKICLR
uniref:Uncharacterized protein n=1 Tax=Myotis myotis TaxID=51298 RepID=A0A7J7Z622_MYOMY|nr:hypothetical protein mMyoMyo1_010797 [Myotis myotis]